MFHNITKGLECGTAKLLTQKGWKAYLHSANHGTWHPAVVLTAMHFNQVDELLHGFSRAWHGKRVANIQIPVSFDLLDGN